MATIENDLRQLVGHFAAGLHARFNPFENADSLRNRREIRAHRDFDVRRCCAERQIDQCEDLKSFVAIDLHPLDGVRYARIHSEGEWIRESVQRFYAQ